VSEEEEKKKILADDSKQTEICCLGYCLEINTLGFPPVLDMSKLVSVEFEVFGKVQGMYFDVIFIC